MEGKVSTLRLMFPNSTVEQAISALKTNNWDLDQTIDFMLAQTESEEIAKREEQQQQQQPPIVEQPPPIINRPAPVLQQAVIEEPKQQQQSEEDRILNEFLILEEQKYQQQQAQPQPVPQPVQQELPQPSTIVIEEHKPTLVKEIEIVQRDISLLKNISETLKELETEVKNLSVQDHHCVKGNEESSPLVEQQQQQEEENEDENNNNNNNNNNQSNEFKQKITVEIDQAIVQLESIFSSSLEKTEKILLSLKEEINSWKIKDNVKSFTTAVRTEISDLLASLANFISPEQTDAQRKEREEKRAELERKLQELKEHNRRLEEERRLAIERMEAKHREQTNIPTGYVPTAQPPQYYPNYYYPNTNNNQPPSQQ
eukprot:gene6648-8225_t